MTTSALIERRLDKMIQQMPLPWLPLPTTLSTLSDVAQQMYNTVSSFDQEWQNLRYTPWRFFYLDYQYLQQEILSNNASQDVVARSIEAEWSKVYDFYMVKIGEIERKIQSYYHQRQQQQDTKEELLKSLTLDVHHLYHFAKLNYCGFLRLFMQYDRLFGSINSNNSDLLRRMLINKPFWDHSIVLFDFTFSINYLFCLCTTTTEPTIMVIPTESFFSTVESLQYRKPVHPLSISSSSSTIQSCATALSHQQEKLPQHSNTVKKYWVHPDNILEVMLMLTSKNITLQDHDNNPSSTYTAADEVGHPQGIKSKFVAMSPTSIHHAYKSNKSTQQSGGGKVKITTVYMDTPSFNDYTQRVVEQPVIKQDDDRMSLLHTTPSDKYTTTRVRWFDDKAEREDGYTAIEEKVYYKQKGRHHDYHHQGYKGLGKQPQQQQNDSELAEEYYHWVQQRIWLKSRHLKSWINGNYSYSNTLNKPSCQFRTEGIPTSHAYDKERMENACLQIEKDIHNKLKAPESYDVVLKTTQYRSVYTSNNNKIRISIDTDITMMRPMDTFEAAKEKMTESNHRQMTNSNQYPYYNTSSDNIVRFPYCVVQIEQQEAAALEEDFEWLTKLESSPLLEPVHDFSLFLHGVGTLLCDQVHVFPSWLSKMEFLDIRHCAHRGSLLLPPSTPLPTAPEEAEVPVVVVASSSASSGEDDTHYWSSNTIATIVTCYDDDDEDDRFMKTRVHSSGSSCSSLLSPILAQQLDSKLRRSFDSYCSFDHPTSSRSDPTNCKSCMGKMLNIEHTKLHDRGRNNLNADCPTLYTVIRDAFLWCFGHTREREKEPLLRSKSSNRFISKNDEEACNDTLTSKYHSARKAATITASCIMISLVVSYFVYKLIKKIK